VLGVGNSILKDEGFGIKVIEEMEARREELGIPPYVELMDGATLGIDLLYYIEGRQKIVMLDIVNAGEPPGTIFRFTPEDIKTQVRTKVSMHQVTLFDVLTMADFSGRMPPEAVIIGIQPGEVEWGLELTPEVEAQIPRVIELVMKEIRG
jgi:hydrogenase maturation protease